MLQSLSQLGGELFAVRRYAVAGDMHWSAFNPSIQIDEKGDLWMVFRASNYFFNDSRNIFLTKGRKVQNRMFLGKIDPITYLLDEKTIKEIDMKSIRFDIEHGIEDARLYFDGKHWNLSCTILEKFCPIARICVLTLKSLENPEPLNFEILPCPNEKKVEKNWMPIHKVGTNRKSKLDFFHSWMYTVVKGKFVSTKQPEIAQKFRGGTQIIPIGDGTSIGLIHETSHKTIRAFSSTTFRNQKNIRVYHHRFVRFNEDGLIIQVSEPFIFYKETIEFAAGIALVGDDVFISFGLDDLSSHIAKIHLGKVLLSMKDV